MADNYLETRYEQIFGAGGGAAKHSAARPSLDALLRRSSAAQTDPSYKVHPLQAEAVVRTVEIAFGKDAVSFRSDEDRIIFTVHSDDPFTAGKICQVMELKAAELGLGLNYLKDNDIELIKTV